VVTGSSGGFLMTRRAPTELLAYGEASYVAGLAQVGVYRRGGDRR
jgi:hypothetical protein